MNTITEKVQLLEEQLANTRDEVSQVDLLNTIAYEIRHTDSCLSIKKSLLAGELSQKIDYKKGFASSLVNQGFGEMVQANYVAALQTLIKATVIFAESGDEAGKAHALYNTGVVYSRIGEYNNALDVFQQSHTIRKAVGDRKGEATCLLQLAYIYERFGNTEKSYEHYTECLAKQREVSDEAGIAATLMGMGILKQKRNQYEDAERDLLESLNIRSRLGETHGWLVSMNYLGELYLEKNNPGQARKYLQEAIDRAKKQVPPFPANLCRLYTSLVKVFIKDKQYDDAIQYMEQALEIALENNLKYQVYDIHLTLSELYRQKGDFEHALESYKNFHHSKEEIINLTASTKLKNLELFSQVEDEKKKAEIHVLRNIELKKAYEQLQAAQERLIQSEKMASLGELTAGIAHEIQNPLNFINNFSEINKELIEEMITEIANGNMEEVRSLANDIIENENKIFHHGKRADSIVKGMLQHSRVNTGQKEPTDINNLADEYLRLSYHGLRAKDKSFNAMIKTDFDESIGKINVVSQDIGRVLLNLFNNAFYSVNEKNASVASSPTGLSITDPASTPYQPVVSVSTKKRDNVIMIRVHDNGNGIPPRVAEKIFQPFFTTKPAGHGTGLGLSLAYDIVKAHDGEITMQTNDGEGAEFIIQLPASK